MPGLHYLGFYFPPPLVPVVPPTPVVIVTTALPAITSGVPYSVGLIATGGDPPYTFGVVSGTLPPGLSFSSAGVISGTPAPPSVTFAPPALPLGMVDTPYVDPVTAVGADQIYPFTIRVLDDGNQHDDQAYSLTVWQNPSTVGVEGCIPVCAGWPMKVGTYQLTYVATDAVGHVVRHPYTLLVRPKPPCD